MKKLLALVLFTACGADNSTVSGPDAGVGPRGDADANNGGGADPGYASGTRIKMRTLSTPDGARQFVGWHDATLGEDCNFRKTSDGVTRCMPVDTTPHTIVFSDPTCSAPAVIVKACSPAPKYIQDVTLVPGCNGDVLTYGAVWLLGQQISTIYQKNGNTCMQSALDPTVIAFGVGAEVPLDTFQSATIGVDQ